ncbi:relaxase/mobilization nuclease domain-containing protein [Mucilaginibacter agri]|uniref:Relaxase/mobilization nuclease domain-containing protein n=1 Tax=Mucilaginibacter agri TaxID=2695265 RepID=A0A965ZCL7_9SPHI|nr:relaxase/mobilization nuclease domain-containing protein [Mucilaginibacter agri]NCD68280.1 relaxase/mobilization nuclease domain-containing protein [Mucilaginibacter agri]
MILKIFRPTARFGGVKYNTAKVDNNKGELMKVANFGPLQAFGQLRPQDYINYLTALASLNKNVELPQFHAVISAKRRNYDKTTLTAIAENWLREMGYGEQPYLIVFHKDTGNNHVHMVSSRVDRTGEKINSAFEWKRGQQMLCRVLGYEFALQYRFSTRAQFFMILESRGYPGIDPDEKKINKKIAGYTLDRERAAQIKTVLLKHRGRSDFPDLLLKHHQIELIFHSSDGKKPYGYSIIDHEGKMVFKGSEVLPLRELLSTAGDDFKYGKGLAEKENEVSGDYIRPVSIADDVDDQQIHGMRRRRQRKARTNTR